MSYITGIFRFGTFRSFSGIFGILLGLRDIPSISGIISICFVFYFSGFVRTSRDIFETFRYFSEFFESFLDSSCFPFESFLEVPG